MLLVAMGGCSDRPDQVAPSNSGEPIVNASLGATANGSQPQPSSLPPSMAGQVAGTWKAVGEICDPDADRKPNKRVAAALLTLTADGHYRRVEAGEDVRGAFTLFASQKQLTITLDGAAMLSRYNFVNGRLENWGEGEAVYPCGTIFERVNQP